MVELVYPNTPFNSLLLHSDGSCCSSDLGCCLIRSCTHVDYQEIVELIELMSCKWFGKEVSEVPSPWYVDAVELLSSDPVYKPEESHVHGLRSLSIDLAFGYAEGNGVVHA